MIGHIYTLVGQAFDTKNYNRVIELIEEAMQIPRFGFNMVLLYKYGYALLKEGRIKEGVRILKVIVENDIKPGKAENIQKVISQWERYLTMDISEYLEKGYQIEPGLIVYLKPNCQLESEVNYEKNRSYNPYLIWKIENGKVYAFPIKEYANHGQCLKARKYFKDIDCTASPILVIFDVNSISKVYMKIDRIDFNLIIKDLYERSCIFGAIDNTSKNCFVIEIEKSLSINVGDLIAIYNPSDRVRNYYFILDIDAENSCYKAIKTGHINGEIGIKEEHITDIPITSYIIEKIPISLENQQKLKEASSNIEGLKGKR